MHIRYLFGALKLAKMSHAVNELMIQKIVPAPLILLLSEGHLSRSQIPSRNKNNATIAQPAPQWRSEPISTVGGLPYHPLLTQKQTGLEGRGKNPLIAFNRYV